MAYFAPCTASSRSYFEALELAERLALHSYFDQHIVEDHAFIRQRPAVRNGQYRDCQRQKFTFARYVAHRRTPVRDGKIGRFGLKWRAATLSEK